MPSENFKAVVFRESHSETHRLTVKLNYGFLLLNKNWEMVAVRRQIEGGGGELYVDQPSSFKGDMFFSLPSSAAPALLLFLDGLTERGMKGGGSKGEDSRRGKKRS